MVHLADDVVVHVDRLGEEHVLQLDLGHRVRLEALGQVYAKWHGIAVVAVRLGWCPRDAGQVAEIAGNPRHQDVYLSPGDAGRFFAAAVEAETLPPFAILYATSRYKHERRYDLSACRELLGWEPREQWPTGVE